MIVAKSIVSVMLASFRLDGNNYDLWHQKINSEMDYIDFISLEASPLTRMNAAKVKLHDDEV